MHQRSEPMEDRLREILEETKPCVSLKKPAEQKGKRPSRQEDGPNAEALPLSKAANKKTQKEQDKITRPKKAAAAQQMPATPKQLPTPKRTAQPSSNATPKQTDAASPAVRQTALAHRNKDGSLYKHASAPSALPARQQPSEAQQLRGLPTRAAAFAIPAAQRVPSGQPKPGSAPFSFLAPPSQQEQELRSVLLSKWAGPGFSLPPTPEALPMPSASLLASKKKKSS